MIKGVAKEANLAATIGDILLIDFTVPDDAAMAGKSAEALMLQMTRYLRPIMIQLMGWLKIKVITLPTELRTLEVKTKFRFLGRYQHFIDLI